MVGQQDSLPNVITIVRKAEILGRVLPTRGDCLGAGDTKAANSRRTPNKTTVLPSTRQRDVRVSPVSASGHDILPQSAVTI